MSYRSIFLTFITLCFFSFSRDVPARNVQVVILGGEVHMNGRLTEGACTVSAESRDMHIDMGQYTSRMFDRVGTRSTTNIPFTIRLTECSPEVAEGIGFIFSGMTDPKEPDVFLVTSAEGGAVGISGNAGYSGLGLLISDVEGNQEFPGKTPAKYHSIDNSEMELHYLARYISTSRSIYPGLLRSEVWFDISYP